MFAEKEEYIYIYMAMAACYVSKYFYYHSLLSWASAYCNATNRTKSKRRNISRTTIKPHDNRNIHRLDERLRCQKSLSEAKTLPNTKSGKEIISTRLCAYIPPGAGQWLGPRGISHSRLIRAKTSAWRWGKDTPRAGNLASRARSAPDSFPRFLFLHGSS